MNIQQGIARLVTGESLDQEHARTIMQQIMTGEATPAQIGAYVTALRMKGETVDEIAGSAQAMREQAIKVCAPGTVVDTCGTGGDGAGTFNISTTAAFVVAACGITVAKHGNRSISSKSGSADVLQALGVHIDAKPDVVERCLAEVGIGFLFAPHHHSAMRHAAAPRKELAIRTLFNLLGPLANPASASHQLLGVFDRRWTDPLAHVLGRLGSKRALVVHGLDGLDEITTTAPTQISELDTDGSVRTYQIDPAQFALPLAHPEDLMGGDVQTNADMTLAVLDGKKGPHRDIVALNAGAALWISTAAADIGAGLKLALAGIDSGKARACLDRLVAVSNS